MKKCRMYLGIVMMLVCYLMGCENKETPMQTKAKDVLKIYFVSEDSRYEACVESFEKKNPQINVELVRFDTQEELANQYANDVGMGTGPDVLLLTDDTTLDIFKAVKNDNFADLTPYFEEDSTFIEEKYFESAFEAGCYQNRQIVVPLGLNVYSYTISSENQQTLPIENIDKLNGMEVMNALMQFEKEEMPENSDIEVVMYDSDENIVQNILRGSGVHLVELETTEIAVKEEDIEQLFKYTGFAWQQQEKANSVRAQAKSQEEMLSMLGYGYSGRNPICDIRGYEEMYYSMLEENVYSFIVPPMEESGIYEGVIVNYGVVDAKSSNIKGAYEFLRYAMDYTDYNNANDSLYVNKGNARLLLAEIAGSKNRTHEDGTVFLLPEMSPDNYALMEDMINNLDRAYLPNRTVEEVYYAVINEYLNNAMDFEECFQELQKRLQIYWNE